MFPTNVILAERINLYLLDRLGNENQDLHNSSHVLLPLSHWAHGRGVEASVLMAAQAISLGQFQLSFSPSQFAS